MSRVEIKIRYGALAKFKLLPNEILLGKLLPSNAREYNETNILGTQSTTTFKSNRLFKMLFPSRGDRNIKR